jgi:hypothetical protein
LLNAIHAGQWSPSGLRAYASSASKDRQYWMIVRPADSTPRSPLEGLFFSSFSIFGIARKTGSHRRFRPFGRYPVVTGPDLIGTEPLSRTGAGRPGA